MHEHCLAWGLCDPVPSWPMGHPSSGKPSPGARVIPDLGVIRRLNSATQHHDKAHSGAGLEGDKFSSRRVRPSADRWQLELTGSSWGLAGQGGGSPLLRAAKCPGQDEVPGDQHELPHGRMLGCPGLGVCPCGAQHGHGEGRHRPSGTGSAKATLPFEEGAQRWPIRAGLASSLWDSGASTVVSSEPATTVLASIVTQGQRVWDLARPPPGFNVLGLQTETPKL